MISRLRLRLKALRLLLSNLILHVLLIRADADFASALFDIYNGFKNMFPNFCKYVRLYRYG